MIDTNTRARQVWTMRVRSRYDNLGISKHSFVLH